MTHHDVREAMRRHMRWGLSVLLAGVLAYGGTCLAGPEEDYQAGLKSYQDGDVVGAMPGLRKAANAGHAKAQVLLAELLDRSEFDEEAVAYYRKAADQGDADGMFGYGVMVAAGEGVKKKDPAEGRRWIQKAAEQGHKQAIAVIGQAYLKAELGITESQRATPEALRWIELAAHHDYLPAVDALADAYRTGSGLAVTANAKLAEEYLAQANRLRGIDPAKKKKKGRKIVVSPPAG